jgi:hypothetical protein
MSAAVYPVRVEARLDRPLSRWLWLVKWFLAIPHYVVLALLWAAFVLLSVGAFFAILFTGRYPRGIFEFNLGVLRWTWRVHYYTFGALATDRYPPFTLEDVPDYPARLDIPYPDHLSRGLVLVKWWLLAIPHYIVVGIFLGGGTWAAFQADHHGVDFARGGLVGLLVCIAGVVLLFTGRYPQHIYDFVLGMDRWALRVAAYAGLMTDEYPPFRFDMGGTDPGGTLTLPPPATPGGPAATEPGPYAEPASPPSAPGRRGWTAGRVIAVVVGSLLGLTSFGLFAGGGVLLWADNNRDGGYVTTSTVHHHSDGYAITSDRISLGDRAVDWGWPEHALGTVRIRVTGTGAAPVFVGIAPAAAAEQYLAGVAHNQLSNPGRRDGTFLTGGAPSVAPTASSIWVAQATGTGTPTVTWKAASGDWTIVVMNADGSRPVDVTADVGATLPALGWIVAGLFIGGGVLLLISLALVIVPVRRAGRA